MIKRLFLTCMRASLLFTILVGSAQANLTLANGYASGSWWHPEREGEGFFVEVIGASENPLITVAMYSYDELGNQLWLVGTVAITSEATVATVPVILVEGPVWGTQYDPADQDITQFGDIVVQFPTCDSALFNVNTNVPGLESGAYSLVRLSEIISMDCVEPPPPNSPPPGSTQITPGLWVGHTGEYETCFFVNAEGTKIIETDECDQGKSFSTESPGVEIDIDGHQNPDDCIASVVCDAAWDIQTSTDSYGVEFIQVICANDAAGAIGQVIFDTGIKGRARAFEGVSPDGRLCYGPDVVVAPAVP